jgi:hypothetical protein
MRLNACLMVSMLFIAQSANADEQDAGPIDLHLSAYPSRVVASGEVVDAIKIAIQYHVRVARASNRLNSTHNAKDVVLPAVDRFKILHS